MPHAVLKSHTKKYSLICYDQANGARVTSHAVVAVDSALLRTAPRACALCRARLCSSALPLLFLPSRMQSAAACPGRPA